MATSDLDAMFSVDDAAIESPKVEKEVPVEGKGVSDAKKEQKRKAAMERVDVLKDEIAEGKVDAEKLGIRSNDFKAIKVLAYTDKGNVVMLAPEKYGPMSKNIGYRIENTSNEPIEYVDEIYSRGEDGSIKRTAVTAVIKPGEFADMSRFVLATFFSKPEISGEISNGYIKRGSTDSKEIKGPRSLLKRGSPEEIRAEIEAHYFQFSADADMSVNDDSIKLQIGTQDPDTSEWSVKKEFWDHFAYLEMVTPAKQRESRSGSISTRKTTAAAIRAMFEGISK